jgi:hypothetical protein
MEPGGGLIGPAALLHPVKAEDTFGHSGQKARDSSNRRARRQARRSERRESRVERLVAFPAPLG